MVNDREFLKRALRRLAEETFKGQDPNAHPTVEELIAHHAGELSPDRESELERHLGLCHECPDLILALVGFSQLPGGGGGSSAEVDSAWEEMRKKLAAQFWFEGGRRSRRAGLPAFFTSWRPVLAAVAVVVVACLGLILFRGDAAEPRIVTQPPPGEISELPPAVRGSGGSHQIQVPPSAGFTLEVMLEGSLSPEYQIDLRRAAAPGGSVWSHPWRPYSSTETLFLEIPPGFLPAGEYQLELRPLVSGKPSQESPDVRKFQLSFR
jgi:anti-sigma factor RsiW